LPLSTRINRLLLPMGVKAPQEINVVIEIACGSRNKYEYDKELDIFRLDRALHSAMFYPGDYGFIPQTLGYDGDPMDVIVMVSEPSFPGCLLVARPIGVLHMIDEGERDEKILAVPCGEPEYAEVHNYTDIPAHRLLKIQHFFESYKLLEGKTTSSNGWGDAQDAQRLILESAEMFKKAPAPRGAAVSAAVS
jgi:inorganic pyrophosphatase